MRTMATRTAGIVHVKDAGILGGGETCKEEHDEGANDDHAERGSKRE